MSSISEAEKKQRRIAVDSTIGTHEMEGLLPDAATRRILERYAEGELSLAEFGAAMEQHAQEVLAKMRLDSLAGAA